jgi:hypothetical protein
MLGRDSTSEFWNYLAVLDDDQDFTNQELQELIAWLKNRIASNSEPAPIQEMVLKKCEEVYLDRLNKNPKTK